MWGFDARLPTLRTAVSMAQKAQVEGWEMARTHVNAAIADCPTHFASATEWAKGATADGAAWAKEHPFKAAAYGTAGVVSVATVAVPGAVAAPVLALGGFGSNGIVGGSIAAGIQSGIGNVVAPSIFATCQSAGAGGYGVAAVNTAVQAGGTFLGAGTGFKWWRRGPVQRWSGQGESGQRESGQGKRDQEEEGGEEEGEEEEGEEEEGEEKKKRKDGM